MTIASAKGRKAKPRPHPGGPDMPESNRAAKVVSARLDDEPREALEALGRRWKLSRSATVARLALETLARGDE